MLLPPYTNDRYNVKKTPETAAIKRAEWVWLQWLQELVAKFSIYIVNVKRISAIHTTSLSKIYILKSTMMDNMKCATNLALQNIVAQSITKYRFLK